MTPLRLGLLFIVLFTLSCNFIQLQPTPTATRPPVTIKRNPNAECLSAAKAAITQTQFGFAPLLVLNDSRLTLTANNLIHLTYPPQPDDPNLWVSVDSFALAYGVQQKVLANEVVTQAKIGYFPLAAPIGGNDAHTRHFATWVNFKDGNSTIVDLTPLAINFGANHPITHNLLALDITRQQFIEWQKSVPFNELQPMSMVKLSSGSYYLLGQATASETQITFSLQAHPVQIANYDAPLELSQGSRIDLTLNRTDLSKIQALLRQEGVDILNQKRDLWQRHGDDGPDLTQVLEQNLSLLWHMATKLQIAKTK